MPNYFENKRKMHMPNLYSFFPPIVGHWQNELQGPNIRRNITRTYKSVVICHSIIMFKSVLSCISSWKGLFIQYRYILNISAELVASFIRLEMDINSWPTWFSLSYIYNVLSWITTGAYISYTKSLYNLTNSSFTFCLGNQSGPPL